MENRRGGGRGRGPIIRAEQYAILLSGFSNFFWSNEPNFVFDDTRGQRRCSCVHTPHRTSLQV